MINPLLTDSELPLFSQIAPEHIEPALDEILAENRAQITALLQNKKTYTWENLLQPLEDLGDRLDKMWSPVSHMHAVVSNDALRAAYHACLPKLSAYATELGQNEQLYQAYRSLADSAAFKRLNTAQQKAITDALLDFHLSGIDLNTADKERYAAIQQQLSLLTSRFEENLLDATDAWQYPITNKNDLNGLPDHVIAAAEKVAQEKNLPGWMLTLEAPCFQAVMMYADNPTLREQMYTAYVTRASDQGPHAGKWDNSSVMQDILTLRRELAALLGYKNYAELSLATKMAKQPQRVLDFLHDLAKRAHALAVNEFNELTNFAKEKYFVEKLSAWDLAYYREKLRLFLYEVSEEELRPYFPEDHVLHGMFDVIKHLFGMHVTEVPDVDTWHKDVRFFEVRDNKNQLRGQFYLDLYARPQKRGGAWMDESRVRRRLTNGRVQTPVAYLTCNFTPPTNGQPTLFTHEEVITLFHEFGHVLHHILTQVDYADVSGINGVAWDAVELPSQFLENWCWQKEALNLVSRHYQTATALPNSLFEKILAAKNFHSALHIMRQLEFALFDFRLHMEFDPTQPGHIEKILQETRDETAAFAPPAFNRFQHGFSHIFAGGYAAGYYSYLWAEVLSSDAFAKFLEKGIFDPITGEQFLHTILEQGGSREAMELFVAFRGREPTIDAFLQQAGL